MGARKRRFRWRRRGWGHQETLEVCSLLRVFSIRAEFEMLIKSQSSNLILQPINFHSLTDSYLLVWVRAARTGGVMRTLEEQPEIKKQIIEFRLLQNRSRRRFREQANNGRKEQSKTEGGGKGRKIRQRKERNYK